MSERDLKDEWKQMQERTFTKWFNNILSTGHPAKEQIENLQNDLKDGVKLIQLLEILTGRKFKYTGLPKHEQQKIENLDTFFRYMDEVHIRHTNIGKRIAVAT